MAKRIDLNKVTHSVRASQAVLQYGVGAMVDFPEPLAPISTFTFPGSKDALYKHLKLPKLIRFSFMTIILLKKQYITAPK